MAGKEGLGEVSCVFYVRFLSPIHGPQGLFQILRPAQTTRQDLQRQKYNPEFV